MNYNKLRNNIETYGRIKTSNPEVYNERSYLSIIKGLVQWRELSSEERHKKRRFVLSVIRKTGNAEEFIVETTVIELYELVEQILKHLEKEDNQDLKTRLEAMLGIFIFHVNEQRDTRRMATTSFKYIINIGNQCLEENVFLGIREELQRMVELFAQLDKLMEG